MPRNRQHIPRDRRAAALLDAAIKVFIDKGYDRTTMTDISEAAGVSRASIYWYYSSKDDVFAAVMNELYADQTAKLDNDHPGDHAFDRLVHVLRELYPYRSLHMDMHPRITHSEAVRVAHDTFMSWIRSMVSAVVDETDTDVDREMLADVIVATFEGARSPSETRPANELIPFLLTHMLTPTNIDHSA